MIKDLVKKAQVLKDQIGQISALVLMRKFKISLSMAKEIIEKMHSQ